MDALWIGVDVDEDCGIALNIFRKVGDSFELVKMIEGSDAEKIYNFLTKGGEESNAVELNL